jgi:hypothetical protein
MMTLFHFAVLCVREVLLVVMDVIDMIPEVIRDAPMK